eukprot:CAMPEP_0203829402 /NCGR_PEP_ID=MMETSP0115-20131106/63500_1 /ASSEMBLY_ACC=CAM_ASM_000227 /TAXON_ID=33651 /ORGANISM="Bicosoecid sp, Strain ms1" /LENGTH=138 /DNA_ID=CAMNT_0050738465 /DNA_START=145 /DNA_END=562 /DNA_ORIENTATION=-
MSSDESVEYGGPGERAADVRDQHALARRADAAGAVYDARHTREQLGVVLEALVCAQVRRHRGGDESVWAVDDGAAHQHEEDVQRGGRVADLLRQHAIEVQPRHGGQQESNGYHAAHTHAIAQPARADAAEDAAEVEER